MIIVIEILHICLLQFRFEWWLNQKMTVQWLESSRIFCSMIQNNEIGFHQIFIFKPMSIHMNKLKGEAWLQSWRSFSFHIPHSTYRNSNLKLPLSITYNLSKCHLFGVVCNVHRQYLVIWYVDLWPAVPHQEALEESEMKLTITKKKY